MLTEPESPVTAILQQTAPLRNRLEPVTLVGDPREEKPDVTNGPLDSKINARYVAAEPSLTEIPNSDKPTPEQIARYEKWGTNWSRKAARMRHLAFLCTPEYREQVLLGAAILMVAAQEVLSIPAVRRARMEQVAENIRILYGKR